MENEILYSEYIVTCETENCGNSGFTIEVKAPADNPIIICGICSARITDVSPKTDSENT
jgi:hypothetical protein